MRLMHLCDATLPTGGFAHSGGIEAALQFGLLGTAKGSQMHAALRQVTTVAIASAVQQQVPFALEVHDRMTSHLAAGNSSDADGPWPSSEQEVALARAISELNAQQHAMMAPNGPGCRASLQLGASLTRIATIWLESTAQEPTSQEDTDGKTSLPGGAERGGLALSHLRGSVHGALALGGLAVVLGLPRDTIVHAFVYMSARDAFSAAVRLNLVRDTARHGLSSSLAVAIVLIDSPVLVVQVGPLAAVPLQQQVISAVMDTHTASSIGQLTVAQAAGSAPLLEAAHACHDLLERRIFQT